MAQKGELLIRLPCMLVACTEARKNGDPSNVARFMSDQCVGEIIICSTNIRASDAASIGGVTINTNCGGGQVPTPNCLTGADCPIGYVCLEQKCAVACTTSATCTAGLECIDGGCQAPGANSGLSVGAISGIVIAIALVITLVAVLCWYFLVYKPAH